MGRGVSDGTLIQNASVPSSCTTTPTLFTEIFFLKTVFNFGKLQLIFFLLLSVL